MTSPDPDDLKPRSIKEEPAHPPIGGSHADGSSQRNLEETVDHAAQGAKPEPRKDPSAPKGDLPKSFGRYEVRCLLGRGGFGSVYLGYDQALQREVAIKVAQLQGHTTETQEAFLQEARQLAKLKHPGIVTVYDVGVQGDAGFIVTDYLKGQSLSSWLKHHAPSWQVTVRIIAAIADALDHAHAQRTIHRDLKPANIILVDDEHPVLVDFGLALSDLQTDESQRGIVMGTPAFLSPEQARGQGHRIDGRTDIFSLGVTLYFMLTGRLPFGAGDLEELLREIQEDDPQPPRQLVKSIPRDLESICLKSMAKRLKDRYTTASDMAQDLRRLLTSPGPGIVSEETVSLPAPLPATPPATAEPKGGREVSVKVGLSSARLHVPTPPSGRSSQRRTRGAERRRITVWHCACESFRSAELLESLDPEEQHDLLVEFQNMCREVAEQYRGAVVKTTDHGVQLCFGFPVAYEDAAPSAVRAGLEVMERLTALNLRLERERKLTLSAIVAIHSDLAVVQEKDQETEKLSIVGSVMSLVDQIEALAEPNCVVLSEDTHRLIKGYFECTSTGAHRLKGATADKQLYRVVKERALGSRVDVVEPTGLTPLIGRDREVGLLEERWQQATEGIGQVVLLIGEAGIGKSRLVHGLKEFVLGQFSGRGEPIIEWRTTPHHQNSSLYPAIECFERVLGISRHQPAREKLDRLVNHLDKLGLGGPENAPILASLLSIPLENRFSPLQLNPQKLKEKTLDLLASWLREQSGRQPVLFIVEDLHWVDPTTLEFLENLLDDGMSEQLLTLFTFRPEFTPPWRNQSEITQVALHRLTKRQIAEMMVRRAKLKNIPQRIIDQVAERTDGVPLFVEEFTTMVLTSGKVREKDGSLEISESFPLHEIPATLQDLLMARLDRMAGNIELVQLASALGREFSLEVLHAVAELSEGTLQAELAKLVAADLFHQRGRAPNIYYQFKHALIQDAAYQSMLKKKRQQIHQQVAQVLESKFPDACAGQPELLAHHFAEAGEFAKAVEYWSRAGTRALERCAHQEAIRHLTRALDVLKSLPESTDRHTQEIHLHISLGVPLQATLGYSAPEVEANYARAHELCLKLGLSAPLFPVLYGLFRYYMLQARYDKALELGEQLRQKAEAAQSLEFTVAAHRAIGATCFYRGESAKSIEYLEKVLAVEPTSAMRTSSYRYDVVDLWITSRSYLAWVLWLRGYPDRALAETQAALAAARGLEHPFSMALAWSFASWLYQFRNDVDAAAVASDQAIGLSKERGYAFWIGWAQVKRGWVMAQRGQLELAIGELTAGLKAWRAQGSELGSSYYLTLLADVYGKVGKLDDALETLAEAQRFAERHGEGFWMPEIHRTRGEIHLLRGANSEVDAAFQQALAVAREQEAKSLELRAATSLAKLWIEQGNASRARELLTAVVGWFTEGLHSHDMKLAQALLAD